MRVANISVEGIYARCFDLGLTAKVCYVCVSYKISMIVFEGEICGIRHNCSSGTRSCVSVMSEGVLIVIWTSVSTNVQRPICMDSGCISLHCLLCPLKRSSAKTTKSDHYLIVQFIFQG